MTQSSEKPETTTDKKTADAAKQDNAKKSEQTANKQQNNKQQAGQQKVTSQQSTPQNKKPEEKSSSGKGIAILALIISLGGLGAGGWSLMQNQGFVDGSSKQEQQQQALEQELSNMREQNAELVKREQQLRNALAQLPSSTELLQGRELVADLQAEQQQLSQRLDKVLGASRQDWRLAEAEHLLRMASLRLRALHDTNSARYLLEAADQILQAQNDPAAFAAREQLARSIAALRSNNTVDRTGLFVKLGALHQQASQLTHLAPEFVKGKGEQSEVSSGDGAGYWAQWWEQISRYLRVDFNASEQVQPLLAGQSLTQVRLALGLALEQAQWAALNGATEVYQQALQQALAILNAHFSEKDPNVSGLREQISELHEQKVSQELPDLNSALITLEAYINTRSSLKEPSEEESN